jgi:ATP phosphoribosyltransferase regulatory subunit
MGFSFDVEAIRDLLGTEASASQRPAPALVAYANATLLPEALDRLEALHRSGSRAMLLNHPCSSEAEAQARAAERGCSPTVWVQQ